MRSDPFLQALSSRDELPPAVRQLHEAPGRYAGRCTVSGGRGRLNALARRLGRFPPDADDIPVQIQIGQAENTWWWERSFDGHTTRSRLTYDHGAECVRERMGGLTLYLVPEIDAERLLIHIRGLSIYGFRCPRFLLPRSSTVESQDDKGRFHFDVAAEMPGLGPLIRYRGWLAPVHNQAVGG